MSSDLTFVHTVVFQILGVKAGEEETVLLGSDADDVFVTLLRDAERYCEDSDLSTTIGTMLLRGLVGGGPQGEFEQRLEEELAATKRERVGREKEQDFIVVRRRGQVPDWEASVERDVGDLVLRLNGAPTQEHREFTTVALSASLIAISATTGRPVRLTPFAESLVYHRADGKKLIAKELRGGAADLFVSGPLNADSVDQVAASLSSLLGLSELERVLKLYAASLDAPHDRLRSFLSAWTALEIFIGKVFPGYEDAFLDALAPDHAPQAQAWYVKRIKEVMKSRYRSRDRFALVASSLDPANADADIDVFKRAKSIRDDLAHGRDVDEQALPVAPVQQLLAKHLRLHSTPHA